MDELLQKVKQVLGQTEDTFNDQLKDLINACLLDLQIAGVAVSQVENVLSNPLIIRAVITFCRVNFGEPDDYDRLKRAYDEQKAQLSMYTGFTVWTEAQQ